MIVNEHHDLTKWRTNLDNVYTSVRVLANGTQWTGEHVVQSHATGGTNRQVVTQ